ncbi:piggyBac transposable element-derived protein 4-like [Solenopsis invicta]|uniref:piggyBac transposable element-derived protein 4-like n=1 Tax=Solenopsis invicta TaxID=13686 RepID=UPI00193D3F47|nr:piggyBac transposable element-derived protein 4-like [Solenopsis invicta]
MPKRKLSTVRIEKEAALEVESEDKDFEEDEDNYEPTTEEIAAADAENYDSDSGESIEYLSQELQENVALDRFILYKSKDGKITFSTEAAELPRNRRYNIINSTPGPTVFATSRCTDILSSFLLFLEPIENEILKMTNLYGIQTYKNDWEELELSELRAYFGLLLFGGVFRSYGEEIGRPIFRATMSRDRFQKITRCIRFDNRADRAERRVRDKLAPIRNVYEKWNKNLSRLYNPGENITVDEQLVPFRGRCPFKQYIPSKPARYGLKIWAVCDSQNAYTWNTQVYTGKAPNTRPEINQGKRVVLELTDGLQGRMVVADNFFTSHDLAVELLKRGLTFLGTVRKNKPFVPPKLLDMKKKPSTYPEFLFDNKNKISIVSYVPKKNRFVLLMSSAHMSRNVSANAERKPIMILDYNKYKGGVDQADQMIATYTCKRKINRWPAALFGYILDTSALNIVP